MKELSYHYLEQKIDYSQYPEELKKVRNLLDDIYKRNLYLRENKDIDPESPTFTQFGSYSAISILHALNAVTGLLKPEPAITYINDRSGQTLDIGAVGDSDELYCKVSKSNGSLRDAMMTILTHVETLLRFVFIGYRLGKDKDHARKIAVELATYNGYKE